MVATGVPAQLPRLGGVEAHAGPLVVGIGVAHHTRTVAVGAGALSGVAQAEVVSNFVHLAAGISAPVVVVVALPPGLVRVRDPAPAVRADRPGREAVHDVIEPFQFSHDGRRRRRDFIPDRSSVSPVNVGAYGHLGHSVHDVRVGGIGGGEEQELVVRASLHLGVQVDLVGAADGRAEDGIGDLGGRVGGGGVGRGHPKDEDVLGPDGRSWVGNGEPALAMSVRSAIVVRVGRD
mmetsp:Transcript_13329/g.24851  ORF Transcript_13329/g.24851 Transcript_13329/m.24851 type:complete len:234 (+) Transcript_13329:1230-1931(+)